MKFIASAGFYFDGILHFLTDWFLDYLPESVQVKRYELCNFLISLDFKYNSKEYKEK
jgi:hypothetical protein